MPCKNKQNRLNCTIKLKTEPCTSILYRLRLQLFTILLTKQLYSITAIKLIQLYFLIINIYMKSIFTSLLLFLIITDALGQKNEAYKQEEIIYARHFGMALTTTMVKPARPNGYGIISVVSGSWVSEYRWVKNAIEDAKPLLDAGYTLFFTLHSSAPRFDIAVAADDVKHAIQYIRYNAKKYEILADKIGITGTSSGGHLALLAGTSDDIENTHASDPVEQVSAKVQAVAVFCPPTDFLNWGKPGYFPVNQKLLLKMMGVAGAFEFMRYDSLKRIYAPIEDTAIINQLAISLSPAQLVTADDAPTLIIQGDKDRLVPVQQSERMKEEMGKKQIPVSVQYKQGAEHTWQNMAEERKEFVKWFDHYLRGK